MKVAVYGKTFNEDFKPYIVEFFEKINQHKVEVTIFSTFYFFIKDVINYDFKDIKTFAIGEELSDDIDFLISIGGDGTFLEAIAFVKDKEIPIIGLNSGRLGFLANISKEEISHALDNVFTKNYSFEHRCLIEVISPEYLFADFNAALNEVTIQKKGASMITIHAFLENEYINSYWTDGLIISTPTGSTAYSLSVGGPIVTPSSNTFIIAPIASHNLSVRPIVIPDDKPIHLKIESRDNDFIVTVDNRSKVLNRDIEVVLQKAAFTIKMIRLPESSFYSTLRNKLMWGADKRN
jgi:NAD+ kinase